MSHILLAQSADSAIRFQQTDGQTFLQVHKPQSTTNFFPSVVRSHNNCNRLINPMTVDEFPIKWD